MNTPASNAETRGETRDASKAESKAEMDRLIEEHFQYEAAGDVGGVMGTLRASVEHDVVGFPFGPLTSHAAIADFYRGLYAQLAHTRHERLRRYYGDTWVVDETLWEGRAHGHPFGLQGKGRPVSFRILHVFEFADGRIARENVWVDLATIERQLPQRQEGQGMGRLGKIVEESFAKGYDVGDLDAYLEYFTPDYTLRGMGPPMGREQFRGMLQGFTAAFSEGHHQIVRSHETGNVVVSEIVWTARHTGTMQMPGREVPATMKHISWPMCFVDTFDGDRIAARHTYLNLVELMMQLGQA